MFRLKVFAVAALLLSLGIGVNPAIIDLAVRFFAPKEIYALPIEVLQLTEAYKVRVPLAVDHTQVPYAGRHSYTRAAVDALIKRRLVAAVKTAYPDVPRAVISTVVSSVYKHARHYDIKPTVALAVIATESRFNVRAQSKDGSMGLMQIIPRYHRDKIGKSNILAADTNVKVGMRILSDCYQRTGSKKRALACFNGALTPEKRLAYYNKINRQERLIVRALKRV